VILLKAAVIGLQWGDEGKGKVVTYLSRRYDCVVRYSGGSNAGHTVDYGNFKMVHHLLPSADIKKQKMMYIGPGVVVDLDVLLEEIDQINNLIPESRSLLRISKQAHVVIPIYRDLDEKIDSSRANQIGTTRRGIGISYANRAMRCGLRLEDFETPARAESFLNEISRAWSIKFDVKMILDSLIEKYNKIRDLLIDSSEAVRVLKEKDLLFEGTQGVLLDVDMGTYPYVTSTNCSTTGIQPGFGYPVQVDKIFGVMKAYTTRVGEGPFPTELKDEVGENLRRLGSEYGATTRRPRRCGWLDLVLIKYAIETSACNALIMTKADILSGFEKIPICMGYKIGGKFYTQINNTAHLTEIEPVYEEIKGWKSLHSKEFDDFIYKIERELGLKFAYISTGPKIEEITEL